MASATFKSWPLLPLSAVFPIFNFKTFSTYSFLGNFLTWRKHLFWFGFIHFIGIFPFFDSFSASASIPLTKLNTKVLFSSFRWKPTDPKKTQTISFNTAILKKKIFLSCFFSRNFSKLGGRGGAIKSPKLAKLTCG